MVKKKKISKGRISSVFYNGVWRMFCECSCGNVQSFDVLAVNLDGVMFKDEVINCPQCKKDFKIVKGELKRVIT